MPHETVQPGSKIGCIAGGNFAKVSESPMFSMKPVRPQSGRVPKIGCFRGALNWRQRGAKILGTSRDVSTKIPTTRANLRRPRSES